MRYWEERAKEWEKARDKKEHKLNAALVTAYKNAADDLQKEIAAWYAKYAGEAGISLSDAKKRLDGRERRALTRSVKAFEKLAKQNKDHSQDEILTKMSAAVHINRLTSMKFQMRYILYELYADVNNELADGLKSFYADEREQMAYEAQMARGKFEPVAMIDEKRISAVLKTPWATDGKDFSARLWNNREQLIGALQSELTRALITGVDSRVVAKTIAQKMNAAQYAASRLVQTEITRVITESDKDTFAEMGIDEVEIVGTLDLHTCDTCGDMDSKHMPRSEAKAGTTAPPFHPNCRCVIVPYDEEFRDEYRIMRDPITGKSKMIENMTFKEWKEKYGKGKSSLSQNVAPNIEQKTSNGNNEGNDVVDVTDRYRKIKNPTGNVVKPEGYSESKHKEEIKMAEWIRQNIGGKIMLLKESTAFGVKTPDYEIDGLFWDLKTISSEKAADSAIRHGIKQIVDKPGGVILRYCGNDSINLSLIKEKISDRLQRSKLSEITVLLIKDEKLLMAMQSKK